MALMSSGGCGARLRARLACCARLRWARRMLPVFDVCVDCAMLGGLALMTTSGPSDGADPL